jgi:hypothetical protein
MAKRFRQTVPVSAYVLYGVLTACFITSVLVAIVSRSH